MHTPAIGKEKELRLSIKAGCIGFVQHHHDVLVGHCLEISTMDQAIKFQCYKAFVICL
jgi:hypothetical protein